MATNAVLHWHQGNCRGWRQHWTTDICLLLKSSPVNTHHNKTHHTLCLKTKMKNLHENSILESFEHFHQMSSKSIIIISNDTISKSVHLLRQSVDLAVVTDRQTSYTDPAVGCLIHITLHLASILYEVVDSPVTQCRYVRSRKYCLYTANTTAHTHTHTINQTGDLLSNFVNMLFWHRFLKPTQTTRMPSCYMDEDYPAGPEIQQTG